MPTIVYFLVYFVGMMFGTDWKLFLQLDKEAGLEGGRPERESRSTDPQAHGSCPRLVLPLASVPARLRPQALNYPISTSS